MNWNKNKGGSIQWQTYGSKRKEWGGAQGSSVVHLRFSFFLGFCSTFIWLRSSLFLFLLCWVGWITFSCQKKNNSINQSINILWRDPEYTLQMCIWEMEGFGMLNWKQHQWQWLMRKQAVQQATVARNCYPFPTCSHDLSGTAQPILKWGGGLTRLLRKVWGREEGVEWQPNTKFLSSLVTNNASKAAKSGKSGQFLTIM